MKRFALLSLVLALAGCAHHLSWFMTWSSGVQTYTCPAGVCFTFPTAESEGSANDLQHNWSTTLPLGETLTVPFEIVTPNGLVGYLPADSDYGNLRATLMLDIANDDNVTPYYRWYCTGPATGTYVLGSADNTPQILSCPLTPFDADGNPIWTDVNGDPDNDTKEFENVLKYIGSINVVFGGDGGLAHGVQASGDAVWEQGSLTIK